MDPLKTVIDFAFPNVSDIETRTLKAAFHLGLHVAIFHPEVGNAFLAQLDPVVTESAEDLVAELIVYMQQPRPGQPPSARLVAAHVKKGQPAPPLTPML